MRDTIGRPGRGAEAGVALTLVTAIAPVVWGTTYAVTTELLPPGRPMTAAVIRAGVAGLVLLAVAPGLPPIGWRVRVAVLGVLNVGAFFPLLFVSAYRLPGGLAAVVGSLQPLVVAAAVTMLGWGRPPRLQVLLAVAAAGGVTLMTVTSGSDVDLLGLVAAVAGTTSMAFGILLSSRWGRPPGVRPLTITAWQLVVGAVVVVPFVPLLDSGSMHVDVAALLGYGWLALVGGALAYGVWLEGARRLPPTSTSLLSMLSPLVAAALGWVVLGEELSPVQTAGLGLALGAAAAGQWVGLGAARRAAAGQGEPRFVLRRGSLSD